jgi:hypothetical protein
VKSRAAENHILYNRLSTEKADASYELDLPNGGASYVIGNVIYQSPSSVNGGILTYQKEGPHPANPSTALYIVNNTFVNLRTPGPEFIALGNGVTTPPVIRNNIFAGPGATTSFTNAALAGNVEKKEPGFQDPGHFDFRLTAGSAGIGAGVSLPANLRPERQYVHPACSAVRRESGKPDAGAFGFAAGSPKISEDAPARCRKAGLTAPGHRLR